MIDPRSRTTERRTVDIPEAARILGIGRNAGYELARAGVLPTLLVGARRRVVSVEVLERMLSRGAD